jgi:hypothetical protein
VKKETSTVHFPAPFSARRQAPSNPIRPLIGGSHPSDRLARRSRRHCRQAVALTVAAVSLAGAATASATVTPTVLANTPVTSLIQSTGNLYWTSRRFEVPVFENKTIRSGVATPLETQYVATVYRASKSNTPGAEQPLYTESHGDPGFGFGAITYANVGGSWFGYFVANYGVNASAYSLIERVPLTGGQAVALPTSATSDALPAYIGTRDLTTDGSFLYWADAAGIRRMAIGGGTVTPLATGTQFSRLGLNGSALVYSSGSSILSVPTTGGASTPLATGASAVTALYAGANYTPVVWGEANGSVNTPGPAGNGWPYQSPQSGRTVTSVSFVAGSVPQAIWTDCTTAGTSCHEGEAGNGWIAGQTSGDSGDTSVQGDGSAIYWGSANALEKYVF